jgi:hypothetical protein
VPQARSYCVVTARSIRIGPGVDLGRQPFPHDAFLPDGHSGLSVPPHSSSFHLRLLGTSVPSAWLVLMEHTPRLCHDSVIRVAYGAGSIRAWSLRLGPPARHGGSSGVVPRRGHRRGPRAVIPGGPSGAVLRRGSSPVGPPAGSIRRGSPGVSPILAAGPPAGSSGGFLRIVRRPFWLPTSGPARLWVLAWSRSRGLGVVPPARSPSCLSSWFFLNPPPRFRSVYFYTPVHRHFPLVPPPFPLPSCPPHCPPHDTPPTLLGIPPSLSSPPAPSPCLATPTPPCTSPDSMTRSIRELSQP